MTGDELLRLADAPRRVVPYEVGDGRTGHMRTLLVEDFDEAGDLMAELGLATTRPILLTMGACDEKGTPLYGDVRQYVGKVGRLPERLARRMLDALNAACDLKAGEAEELAGNSPGRTAGSDTGSGSPSATTSEG
jgi:hypothetical protein